MKELKQVMNNISPGNLIQGLIGNTNNLEKVMNHFDFTYQDLNKLKTLAEADLNYDLATKITNVINLIDRSSGTNEKQLNLFD